VSLENAIRDGQFEDIAETLGRLESIEPDVDIEVYGPDGGSLASSSGSRVTTELEGLLVGRSMTEDAVRVRFEEQGDSLRLVLAMPLRDDSGAIIGGVAVAKPLDALTQDLANTRGAARLWGLVIVASIVCVGLILGRLFMARPLAELMRWIRASRDDPAGALRQVGAGHGRDEIRAVADEFGALLVQLEGERQAREEAEIARRSIERTLEHADKLIAVGQLSARIAHEVGSPLQVLVGRAQAIASSATADAKIQRHARIIAEQSERIVAIIRETMAWAKPPRPEQRQVAVRPEIEAIVALLELESQRAGIRVELDLAADLPSLHCAPGRLQQVVFNLLRNAFSASKRGDVVILRARAQGEGEERHLALEVEDAGEGISQALQSRLFEPFISTHLDDGGLGLGLTVVRSIVESYGGAVTVHSEENKGTRMCVRWPIRDHAGLPPRVGGGDDAPRG